MKICRLFRKRYGTVIELEPFSGLHPRK